MKIVLFVLVIVTGFTLSIQAQSRAVEGVAEFQGKKVPAAVVELPYGPDKVEAAIEEQLSAKGHKGSKAKDYTLYRSVRVGSESGSYDMYVKAERKSRRDKESSVLYVVLVKPNEVASHEGAIAAASVVSGKDFLHDFSPYMEDYNLRLEIVAQENVIKKLEKKQTELLSDSTDYNKKLLQLNEKILQNSTDMENQRMEIEKQRLTLEAIKSRKKN